MTRILLVEDSPTQAEELRWILESEGFEVDHATDGASGLARLEGGAYDLVISDIVMPHMTGYELCRAIKSSRRRNELPVILLTTLSDPMDIVQGLECGADNFLTKPCEPAYLVGRVRGVMENKRIRAEGKLKVGVEIFFLGRKFMITSDKEQILDLLISTFEDIVRANRDLQQSKAELAAAKLKIEDYARRLEGQVRLSEEKYRALMEHASDAILVADESGTIQQVNHQAEDLLAAPASSIVGRAFGDLVVPAERDYASVQVRRLFEEGRAEWSDLRLSRPGAEPVCTDLSASLVQTDSGRVVLAIARDMTEKNRLQQQLLHNERLATMGTLAAGIAHEINNPTAVILGNLETVAEHVEVTASLNEGIDALEKEMDGPLQARLHRLRSEATLPLSTEDIKEAVRDCTQAGERIRDIVRDLKSFAHIDEGDLALVDVHERIDTTLRMAANELRYRARVEKDYAADLPQITASPGKLNQLLLNLIVNAAQAIEEGHVDQNAITIATRRVGSSVRINVSDTGKGIPPEIQSKIFEPFFTTKRVGVGTGLGLSICRDIVKKHGGDLLVQSEVGRGTTFSILLPIDTGLAPPRSTPPRSAHPLTRLRVLIVDDDPSLLKLYRRLVGRHHDTTGALGGRAALEVLASADRTFDVILSDVMMPDVDGVDLHRYLAERRPGLEKRMIFLTGGAFTTRAIDFLERVPNPRVEKPFVLERLLRTMHALAAAA